MRWASTLPTHRIDPSTLYCKCKATPTNNPGLGESSARLQHCTEELSVLMAFLLSIASNNSSHGLLSVLNVASVCE